MDTVTEDEEELGPNKKRGRGNAVMDLVTSMHVCVHEVLEFYSKFLGSINLSCKFKKKKKPQPAKCGHNGLLSALSWPNVVLVISCMFFHTSVSSCLPNLLSGFLFHLKNQKNPQNLTPGCCLMERYSYE